MNQAAGTWTAAQRKLLPVLKSRLKKREAPIKREIKHRQDKINALEIEVNKSFQIKQVLQKEYQAVKESFDLFNEKAKVLEQTITTLKRELHTQKQTYKMK